MSLWKNLPFDNRTSHEKHLHSDFTKMEGREEVYVNNIKGALKDILTKDVSTYFTWICKDFNLTIL